MITLLKTDKKEGCGGMKTFSTEMHPLDHPGLSLVGIVLFYGQVLIYRAVSLSIHIAGFACHQGSNYTNTWKQSTDDVPQHGFVGIGYI